MNYDLDRNGKLGYTGGDAFFTGTDFGVILAAASSGCGPKADIGIYYVNALDALQKSGTVLVDELEGFSSNRLPVIAVGDIHASTAENVTAHELGHQLGVQHDPGDGFLMSAADSGVNWCRISRVDWNTANK